MAMYAAKSERTKFAFYSDAPGQGSRRGLTLAGELRRAIAEDEIVLYHQPKARLGRMRSSASKPWLAGCIPQRGSSRRLSSFRSPSRPIS